MRPFLTVTLICVAATAAQAQVRVEGSPDQVREHLTQGDRGRRIALSGTGEVEAQADRAVVKLRVTTKHKKLREALADNQRIRAELADHLIESGIRREEISSSRFSSAPRQGLFGKTGTYEVLNTVSVTIHDESQYQAVAGFADDHEQVRYEGIDFEHSDQRQLELDALAEACAHLMAKKQIYEQGLAVQLQMRTFREAPRDRARDDDVLSRLSSDASMSMMREMEARRRPSLFSDQVFTAHVLAEFEAVP